ncbi:MAG: ATP-dependent DNA helicase RecG [Candidatus Gastranaerophilaceae bacterium]
MDNLDQIRQSVEIEIKYGYIDIKGKTKVFSKFMQSVIQKEYKLTKNPKWRVLIEAFERYPLESMPIRRKILNRFCTVLKNDIESKKEIADKGNKNTKEVVKLPNQCDITYVKGVGPKVGYLMNKLNIYTANDLLYYFPKRHVDYSGRTMIKDLVEGENKTIFGYIKSVQSFTTKNNLGVIKVKICDESGSIELNFFQAKANRFILERTKSQFPIGAGIMVAGEVKLNKYNMKLTLEKTTYSIISDEIFDNSNLNMGRIVPIYPLSENLNMKTLRKAVFNALEMFKNTIKTVLPEDICKKYNIMDKKDAVFQMHFPKDMETLERARFSLVFEEFFIAQLRLANLRKQNHNQHNSVQFKIKEDGLVMKFIKNLPFELTNAQKNAVNEILNDLQSDEPMQRLLQGDVGSGKTVVACIMLLAAIECGYQGAIMAPTEILATQHYNNLVNWLTPLGLHVGLFLGSQGKKDRRKEEIDIANGQTHIAVGTHALIQDNIEFANLGAIVIDEQHRFGVKQRIKLSKKSVSPQVLIMTATPIPRTLALSVHGDLDLTLIDELPKGRKPVKTIFTNARKQIYTLIRQQINEGRQAYIVYPLIEESETLSAKAATIEAERLQKEVFPDFKVGLLHGKLKNNEKEKVMNDFKEGKYNILVSTTVVEVGVDVPNATVIVIENAERFGLSQLHQLRGRVGRSDLQSYCILTSSSRNPETKARLEIMTQTNDGFVIAEKDLELRGPGEFLGTRQSGLPDMVVADIVKDTEILEIARKEAFDFIENNNLENYPLLKSCENLQTVSNLEYLKS